MQTIIHLMNMPLFHWNSIISCIFCDNYIWMSKRKQVIGRIVLEEMTENRLHNLIFEIRFEVEKSQRCRKHIVSHTSNWWWSYCRWYKLVRIIYVFQQCTVQYQMSVQLILTYVNVSLSSFLKSTRVPIFFSLSQVWQKSIP